MEKAKVWVRIESGQYINSGHGDLYKQNQGLYNQGNQQVGIKLYTGVPAMSTVGCFVLYHRA
ncbi:MAG: hypothetical protein HOI47_13880 [Candidatus Scalindua sp.]|nr:hypothetical protein [Candidatus Scalindua sp.]